MRYKFNYNGPAFRIIDGVEYPYAIVANTTTPVEYDIDTIAISIPKAINNLRYHIMKYHGSTQAPTLKEEYLHITYIIS